MLPVEELVRGKEGIVDAGAFVLKKDRLPSAWSMQASKRRRSRP
jgi:hypothetical protein